MTRGRWITPDEIPEETICRVLFIPNNLEIIASVNGALSELIYERNWEQVGTITPAEMAEAMATMFFDYAPSSCEGTMEVDLYRDEATQGTAGGGITAATNTSMFFATAESANAGNVSRSGSVFTVQPGLYLVRMEHHMRISAAANVFCWALTSESGGVLHEGTRFNPPTNAPVLLTCEFLWNIDAERTCEFLARSSVTRATDAFGVAMNITGHVEVYGYASFTRLGDAV